MTIEFKPCKKILIRAITEQSLEHFVHNQVMAQSPFVFWHDGILLHVNSIIDDSQITKNFDEEIEEFMHVTYAKLEKFPEQGIKHKFNGFILNVLYGESYTLKEIAAYLKKENTYP